MTLLQRLDFSVRAARLGIKVRVDHIFPPVPSRDSDYAAVTDDYDAEWCGEENGWRSSHPVGYGRSEEAAIADLLEQLEERA